MRGVWVTACALTALTAHQVNLGAVIGALLIGAVCLMAFRKRTMTGHVHGGSRADVIEHETGHMAATRHLGGHVVSATVHRDGSGGYVNAVVPDNPRARIAFWMAGVEAAPRTDGHLDRVLIDRELSSVAFDERPVVLLDARRMARQAISSESSRMRRDAAQLAERGRI